MATTLVLLDIDGTLVAGGPAKEAFETAMLEVYETRGAIEGFDFSGKTDPQIARELLVVAGFTEERIDASLPDLWDRYLAELEALLTHEPMYLLPGVPALLDRLHAHPDVAVALVTGNIARGARLKLASVGLANGLTIGGFGSDHEDRNLLAPLAIARAEEACGVRFARERTVVVGDTPRDVVCGQRAGTRTVAVATGRCDAESLRDAGADRVFQDFLDTDEVMRELVLATTS
ncbi:MAG: HAD family hydrolase [Gemmatimonadota bacterium]|nr:MAG: HAD family hydrolase [Gemmatimonadota bacterium]